MIRYPEEHCRVLRSILRVGHNLMAGRLVLRTNYLKDLSEMNLLVQLIGLRQVPIRIAR